MTIQGQRFLGLELGGSRRTALVTLEFFAHEKKAFLKEIESPVQILGDETPDEALLRAVNTVEAHSIGVDAPLTLPPCFDHHDCPGVRGCRRPATVWMREEAVRQKWGRGKLPVPYAQRPVDLLLRGRWQEDVPVPFPVDDSFGAGRAPLAARMQFLQRKIRAPLLEVEPRLALGGIAHWYGLPAREVRRARDVEEGVEQRMGILDALSQSPRVDGVPHLFLYKSDLASLAQDLSAFDAFLCGLLALMNQAGFVEAPEFAVEWGNVAKPKKLRRVVGGGP